MQRCAAPDSSASFYLGIKLSKLLLKHLVTSDNTHTHTVDRFFFFLFDWQCASKRPAFAFSSFLSLSLSLSDVSRSRPFKLGANLPLARPPARPSLTRQTGRDRQRQTDSVWDDEWRTYLRASESSETRCQPSPTDCRALYTSQPACLHVVSLHRYLSPSVLLLSLFLWQPDCVSAAILVFICIARYVCISVLRVRRSSRSLAVISARRSHFARHRLKWNPRWHKPLL